MESVETKTLVLNKDAVGRKIRRMALEVAEQNTGEPELVIAGIVGNGVVVAQCIAKELKKNAAVNTQIVTIALDKKDPLDVTISPAIDLQDKVIVIVDDVANTGKTMFYALKPFMQAYPKKLQTLVLVERSHKLFPVQTDYAGLTIATTLQEHILVETKEEEVTGAWLY